VSKEIDWLAQVSKHLEQGNLQPSEQKKATATAHRLVGALGSYGRMQGSEIARKIERLLQADQEINSERLLELVTYLKQVILQEDSNPSSSPTSRSSWLLLVPKFRPN
jgi:HPt (histidine-containing phosphotransfer) domain-containing protein